MKDLHLLKKAFQTLCVERRLPWRVEHWIASRPVVQRWEYRRWCARETRLLGRFVRAGDLVFDVGANIGDKAQAFRHHRTRVVCIEPDPRNVAVLRSRFSGDTHVEIIPAGAGSTNGTAMFYPSTECARSTFALDAMRALGDGCTFEAGRPVDVRTLDSLIQQFGLPDFIKIDVEGFEPAVLDGLSQPVRAVSFECHGELRDELHTCLDRLVAIGVNRFNVLLYPVGGVKPYHRLDRLYFDDPVSRAELVAKLDRVHPLAADVYGFVAA